MRKKHKIASQIKRKLIEHFSRLGMNCLIFIMMLKAKMILKLSTAKREREGIFRRFETESKRDDADYMLTKLYLCGVGETETRTSFRESSQL